MKKYYMALCAVCLGMAFTACSSDENEVVEKEGAPLTEIFASTQVATRTALAADGTTVNWSEGDEISVIAWDPSVTKKWKVAPFRMDGEAGSNTTSFFGNIEDNKNYLAVYPKEAVQITDYSKSGLAFTGIVIPTEQHAVANGFDPAANLMVASFTKATANNVEFKQFCAFGKITTTAACKSIKFTPSTACCGTFKLHHNASGVADGLNGVQNSTENTITLLPAEGEDFIPAGTYLIAFATGGGRISSSSSGFVVDVDGSNTVEKRFPSGYNGNQNPFTGEYRGKIIDFGVLF